MTAPTPAADAIAVATPWRAVAVQALATAIAGALALIVGTVLGAVSSGAGLTGYVLIGAVASPQLGLWLIGLGVLVLSLRRASAAWFAVGAVGIAPIATVLASALTRPDMSLSMLGVLWFVAIGWQALGMLGAASVGALSGRFVRARRAARPENRSPHGIRTVAGWVAVGALTAGGALVFALPGQWFEVYFRIGGSTPTVTPHQADRYVWTAALGLGALIVALIAAIVRRRAGLIVLSSIAIGAALIGAALFQVPQGRFEQAPSSPVENHDHPVCFGTTGDCPGG